MFGCQEKKAQSNQNLSEKKVVLTHHEGKQLMETHCYTCHSPKAAATAGRIAPPMIAVKEHYLKVANNEKDFIALIQNFVQNPTTDKVHLKGAFDRFGLMPKQAYPEASIEKIADFMYDYQIEAPEWFKAHWEAHGNKNWTQSGNIYQEASAHKTLDNIGLDYALETKKILGKNLMGTIQKKGTLQALAFCNHHAIPLTDSMATKYNAVIKRVSDKNRNPNNKANAEEQKYIEKFKADMIAKKEMKPVIIERGKQVQFYYPIETNMMCLQCHGKQIKPEVGNQIKKLYPKDLAVGYVENNIRGLWSITFKKQ
ncbi:DUF3365 domain-containing protein [Flavobacterium branchiophilum]